ncbi:MAG TPA: DinB family protein [Gemmatimonadaceae bacterium]
MRRLRLAIACCAVSPCAPLLAQGSGAAGHPAGGVREHIGPPAAEHRADAGWSEMRRSLPQNDVATELRSLFAQVSGWVSRAAEMVPADKYSYRPMETTRTLGQMVGHIADSYNWYCANAAGRNVEWSEAIEKGATDKATITRRLAEAQELCTRTYAGPGQVRALIGNIGHTNLHYGNIITYMRLLGLVPPSS